MNKKIFTRLDRRHTGYSIWTYFIDKNYSRSAAKPFLTLHESNQIFNEWRVWCWQTWGPSKELEHWLEDQRNLLNIPIAHNEYWCWQNDKFNTRIYLKSDKELSTFLLKWSV